MKLNIGSNNKLIGNDYTNVDVLNLPNVDYICDLTKTPWIFTETINAKLDHKFNTPATQFEVEEGSVEEIIMTEVLEHISFRNTEKVLKECYRVLEFGGRLHIQVPDIDAMMRMYVNDELCECIPHKPRNIEDIKPDLNCEKCGGKGRVNPVRWLYAFTGAQKHKFDSHLNIFTPAILGEHLRRVGFGRVEFETDAYNWKIKCNAIK